MLRKNRFFILEIVSVTIVLVVLAVLAIPNFLRQQTRSKPEQMQQAIKVVFDAYTAYKIDHHLYPPDLYPPGDANEKFPCPCVDFFPNYITDPFEILVKEGYLNETPLILKESIGHGFTPPYSYRFRLVKRHAEQFKQEILNVGIAIRWPEASPADDEEFEKKHPSIDVFFVNYKPYEELFPSRAFYAPSNGIDSAGFVFLDIQGNHSPVD